MNWNELITFITNNGIAVVLMFYFLKNNYKSTQDLLKQNQDLIIEIKEMKKDQVSMLEVIKSCSRNAG